MKSTVAAGVTPNFGWTVFERSATCGLAKEKGRKTLDPELNFSDRNDTTNRKISNTQTGGWKGMETIYIEEDSKDI